MDDTELQTFMIPGTQYGYKGTKIDTLMSFKNTCAIGLCDESGSTFGFAKNIEKCVKEIVKSLRHCPEANNLIYRHCHFGSNYREHHGFIPLNQIAEDSYDGCYQSGGSTTLYDSVERTIAELLHYAEAQADQKYIVNGYIYILTDGCDYGSTGTQDTVAKALSKAITSEKLESLVTILIGVNNDPKIQKDLKAFSDKVGFTQYIPLEDANESTLSKLTSFISQSLSSQSQALGSGAPSQKIQSLTF